MTFITTTIVSVVALAAGLAVGFMAGAVFRSVATPCRHCDEEPRPVPYKREPEDVLIREALGQ